MLVVIDWVTLLQASGAPITADQGDAAVEFFESALAFIGFGAWHARSQETPVEKAENVIIPATALAAACPALTGERAIAAGPVAGQEALISPP